MKTQQRSLWQKGLWSLFICHCHLRTQVSSQRWRDKRRNKELQGCFHTVDWEDCHTHRQFTQSIYSSYLETCFIPSSNWREDGKCSIKWGGEGTEESRRRKKNGRSGEGRGRDADMRIRQYHKPKGTTVCSSNFTVGRENKKKTHHHSS